MGAITAIFNNNPFFLTFVFQVASGRFAQLAGLRSTRVPDLDNTSVGNAIQLIGQANAEAAFSNTGNAAFIFKTMRMGFDIITKELTNWQGRQEWFFNREHTDTYEQWYEGRYKRAEVWQKNVIEQLVKKDRRVKELLEFGCGTTRFTRWWKDIGIEATGADLSPFMLGQGVHLFKGDLVLADSHFMPFKDHTFDAVAFITTFEYYRDPVQVIREAARVGRHGIVFGMMNRNSPKVVRRRVQQLFGKNPFYVTATFYTPQMLIEKINAALKGRSYSIEWTCTGLPKWFPVQQWGAPYGDFFGLYVKLHT